VFGKLNVLNEKRKKKHLKDESPTVEVSTTEKYGNIHPIKLSIRLESLKEVFAYFHVITNIEGLLKPFSNLDDSMKRPFFRLVEVIILYLKVKRNYMPSNLILGKTYKVTIYFKFFDLVNPDGGVLLKDII
jgi:hypothetical protein